MPKKSSTIWLCESCGNEFSTWAGKCPACDEWNSLKELKVEGSKFKVRNGEAIESKKMAEVEVGKVDRTKTGIGEFDRVMGGGIVPGSITLLGGEPGIGKSTLILQVASKMKRALYLSAEESMPQITMRAKRLGLNGDNITLTSGPEISQLGREIEKLDPDLIIIDSIQTVYVDSYDATPGSIVQVRECGIFLQQLAKKSPRQGSGQAGHAIILIGHVTKEGNLAGPRILEHLVDTVLYMEGEKFSEARILRDIKNRFGPTNEVGIFSMQEKGLFEVKNPSELFLSEKTNNPGSVITVALEGTRPILIEVQALVTPTHFGYPKRTSSGFDLNRLNLLAAVISKKTLLDLSNHDIYLNIVGGMRVNEPAVDLAVCAAIISSYKNKSFGADTVFIGEVGLLGEVRKVIRQSDREKEAKNLGYSIISGIVDVSGLVQKLK